MADTDKKWRDTLCLPQTSFPMKAGLPKLEDRLLKKWEAEGTHQKQRTASKGREKFILHDGPPYANGDVHMGTAMDKILKDIINRSQQMLGKDAVYVPGWDCHGLPIEWKVEEKFRDQGKSREEIGRKKLRAACRAFAEKWIDRQRMQFQRLGVWGRWDRPYLTMDKKSEAIIAAEFLKFAMSGALYRGLKPVMWSVAEKTALAEAEIEYYEHISDTLFVRFPLKGDEASIVIWTTTPWTIPANRAIAFSKTLRYGVYQLPSGEKLVLADALADNAKKAAKIEDWQRLGDIDPTGLVCRHPLEDLGYDFDVPLLAADFVTDETGTGFVHIAPSHGRDDYDLGVAHNIAPPFMVDDDGCYTDQAPHFEGIAILNPDGSEGSANREVIESLKKYRAVFAQGKLRHPYPHSWRSKTPVIFRATPQWFISMDFDDLRQKALAAIDQVSWYPKVSRNRIHSMVETRPDWVISRQRAWGIPLTIFVNEAGEILRDEKVNQRIIQAIEAAGADAWFDQPAKAFLGEDYAAEEWHAVEDIVDVWFESGATHAFVLEGDEDLRWPASLYLEGTDQHRGWFQSSLLEACGTRGTAPYEKVLTHGFLLDHTGKKMSKSGDNAVSPYDFVQARGSDILRLWVASSDYEQDVRWSDEAIATTSDGYRKLRNALRFLLGNLADFSEKEAVAFDDMPELEQLMLHRLAVLDLIIRAGYAEFNFRALTQALLNFAVSDLSSFYFDIRKDALYCDPLSSLKRRACRTVLNKIFIFFTKWLSPILCFTAEEAWMARFGETHSVHLEIFEESEVWHNQALEEKWDQIKTIRKVILAALEVERQEKRIGSSLEASPKIYIDDDALYALSQSVDMAEIAITSQISIFPEAAPDAAFRLNDVPHIGVLPTRAEGKRCARSWKILPDVGCDPNFPDLSPRDALAVMEFARQEKQ